MNKKIFQYTAFLLLALFTTGTFAQDRRTLDTKVADVLAQMPTSDLVHRDRVMSELAELGPQGFQKLSQLLTPAGVGDDTSVRFAINSLARYSSDFGKKDAREALETNLLKALEEHSDTEIKTFLLNQLNLVGSDESVNAIKKYLADENLVEPATQTLLSIGSVSASAALFEALPKAGESAQATLTKALGELRYTPALRAITHFAGTENVVLRKATLAALANIGSPESYKLLFNAAKEVNFAYEQTNAAEAFLTYADRLGEQGELDLCKKALKSISKANQTDDKLHNNSGALFIYAKHFGYEVMPLLQKAMDSNNKEFRYAALNTAENIGGVAGTRQWIEKAGSVSEEVKAEIIDMLGRRGDPVACDFVKANLNASSQIVREEAIAALVKLAGKEATPLLINHLAEGKDLEAAKAALLQLTDKEHLAPVAAQLPKTSGATKAAFVELIASKAGNGYFNTVLALTNASNQEERKAAFSALKSISTEENIDALIQRLLSVDEQSEINEVQMAVIQAAKGVKEEQTEKGKLLQALQTTNKKERIIAILPAIGGDVALQTVVNYFNSSSGSLKETAFEALISWKDYDAATSLYDICQSTTGEYQAKAFSSFVKQVRSANIPDDQKLLQYRKIMPFASGTEDEKQVINAIGNLKTFLSLIYLEQFLDKNELQQTAARAIMKIALPDSNGENGLSGEKVRTLLKRVASVLKGEESDYDIININNYLDKMSKEKGFVSMFNGKNLDGWQGMLLNGNPIKIAELSEKERAEEQEKANKKMLENWSVKDNTIVFSGKGANLCSAKEYGDFEMIVDWRITKEGDSGIYLRGTPQVQVWDTSRVEVGAQVGSGGLYNNKKYESKPLKVADNPVGEWNTFRITMIGANVTVYLNGELVVDNIPLENFWDRSLPIFEKGTIELQAHGTDLAFRDIYVKEINTDEIGLTEEEKAEGFVSLFNGTNLDGWQGNTTDYFAQDAELVVQPSRGGHGNLFTEKEYSDFIFRFEFQLTPGANNGLGIRAPLEGDAAYMGMELQILDNSAPIYANLKEYQYHGSVYGTIAAKRGFQKPVGEWNQQEVIVKGTRITVTLNGTVILDGDIAEASKNGTRDGRNHPGLKRDKGYIGFLGHGSELKFRNIRIKDLSK
jgi:HEAT repeat protein